MFRQITIDPAGRHYSAHLSRRLPGQTEARAFRSHRSANTLSPPRNQYPPDHLDEVAEVRRTDLQRVNRNFRHVEGSLHLTHDPVRSGLRLAALTGRAFVIRCEVRIDRQLIDLFGRNSILLRESLLAAGG